MLLSLDDGSGSADPASAVKVVVFILQLFFLFAVLFVLPVYWQTRRVVPGEEATLDPWEGLWDPSSPRELCRVKSPCASFNEA